ncbi:hypothetical protein ACFZB9_14020 [Kitasatospora sp. NPDC008050]|uniref:hypothetical protein n=1 Tax=Kitasatospora sp. NPDC008050 TaxID=3364021 RepID=UPI0036E77393
MSAPAGPVVSSGEAMREALARTEKLTAMVDRHLVALRQEPASNPAPLPGEAAVLTALTGVLLVLTACSSVRGWGS